MVETILLILLAVTSTVLLEAPPTTVKSVQQTHSEISMVPAAVKQTGAKEMIPARMIVQHTVVCAIGTVRPVSDQVPQNVSHASHTPLDPTVIVTNSGVDKIVKYTMVNVLQLVKDVLDQHQQTVSTVVNSPLVVTTDLVTVSKSQNMVEPHGVVTSAKITATRLAYGRILQPLAGEPTHINVTNVSSTLTVIGTETVSVMTNGREKLIVVYTMANAQRNVSDVPAHTTLIVSPVCQTQPREITDVNVTQDGPETTVRTGRVNAHVNVSAVTH